jgi:histidinol-phosphatase (PHP family)
MGDYHLHLFGHGPLPEQRLAEPYPDGLIESYVEAAARNGVTELGFTEHLYRCVESEALLGRFWEGGDPDLANQTEEFVVEDRVLSLERYVEAIVKAKDAGLPVKLGLEVDYFPETIEAVAAFLAQYPFDFLIGSVHWIGEWAVDHEDANFEFERRGVDQAYEDYFRLEAQLAASGLVDSLAHVDVVKKAGHRASQEPIGLYEEVTKAASSSGTAVEVSSGGLRNPVAEMYPHPTFLKMFNEAGVSITLGSDGHVPDQAGYAHDDVVGAALAAGYETRLSFDQRQPREVPL